MGRLCKRHQKGGEWARVGGRKAHLVSVFPCTGHRKAPVRRLRAESSEDARVALLLEKAS